MEAAANLQVQELQTKYDRLRELTFDLQTRLDATIAKQDDESVTKPLVPSTPRVLAADGRAKIMTYLKTYTNQMSLTVAILDDPEPYHYGMQIVDALTTVGIRVYVTTVGSFYVTNDSDEALYGVRYTSSCPEPVRHSLEIAGLEPSPSHLTPNRADLYIGLNSRGP
ncbi:hypothetical protein SAMN02799631_00767 [Methylobacterium sp. 174MFSha1.1]|nr:hypothetical protein SAMN02799631_00767 [Methylobacterium sp. 174MFSha1.1]